VKNKKVTIAIISVIALVLVIIGITYAYWLVTETQERENIITTGCLDITLNGEANEIKLQNQFPMTDEDGLKLTPYEFTIINNCNTEVDYQINLESFDTVDLEEISKNALKVAIYKEGTEASSVTPALLSSYAETDTMVENAISANKLLIDTLGAKGSNNESSSYNLLIWIDKDAPISEMKKSFTSKISVTVGQGIVNPYKKGTLAFTMLKPFGGHNSITNDYYIAEEETYYSNMTYDENLTFVWATDYSVVDNDFVLSGELVESSLLDCKAKVGKCGEYFMQDGILYKVDFTTANITKDTNWVPSYDDEGNEVAVEDGYLYSIDPVEMMSIVRNTGDIKLVYDDFGKSYFFENDVFVKFGQWSEDVYYYSPIAEGSIDHYYGVYETMEECKTSIDGVDFFDGCGKYYHARNGDDMYWRVVRINGDGTTRLVYNGTTANNNADQFGVIGFSKYNEYNNDIKYVGYTYDNSSGGQTDSTAKSYIDNWYRNNLNDKYGKYIADGIFCNDREIAYTEGTNQYFAAYNRLENDDTAQLICSRQEDKYSVSSSIGNGYLTYPVGLMTADERFYLVGNDSDDYYSNGDISYTMTPASFVSNAAKNYYNSNRKTYAYQFNTSFLTGNVNKTEFYDDGLAYVGPAPVINLKADVKFTGDGSIGTPYEIVMN